MTKNVGNIERVLRIIVGLAVIAWGVTSSNLWGAVGLVPLLTGVIGWCPPYSIFGFNTCSVKPKSE